MSYLPVMAPPSTPPALHAEEYDEEFSRREENTVIIFDWDDTLLSSSWLAQHGLRLDEPAVVPKEYMAHLEMLQESVITLLTIALKLGQVVIITNAETGWVEMSARKFIPGVLAILSKVKVLSARSTFEAIFPDSPSDWKVQAFYQEINSHYGDLHSDTRKNVLSFGDSIHERQAIHKVTEGLPHTLTKSIKFVERPTVEQLKREVDLVTTCIEELVVHEGNLDLMLTIQLLYG